MSVRIPVIESITKANDEIAAANRALLDDNGILGLNLMASPGAGKTSLIEGAVPLLADKLRLGVIEGDLATSMDAERASAAGATAVQINTGGSCHLDAVMVSKALEQLPLAELDLIIVENVGNLICPAGFQLGTHDNVLVASVPEGDDKPFKHPKTYRGIDILIINKIDLLPYVKFDMQHFQLGVAALNQNCTSFPMSCTRGDGIDDWVRWVVARHRVCTRGSKQT